MSDQLSFTKQAGVAIELEAWINIANPALSFDEGRASLTSLGNTILEEDPHNRRFKCLRETVDEGVVWCCDRCGSYSRSYDVALTHEQECHA